MKRRITSLFLCILMLVSVLASCKDDKNAEESATSESSEAQTSVDNSNPNESENDESSKAPENGSEADPESNGTLFVNGKDISNEVYFEIDSERKVVMLPFIPILKELGHKVTMNSDTEYLVTMYNDFEDIPSELILNTKDKTFKYTDREYDYFQSSELYDAPDGHEVVIETVNSEFLIDSITFSEILSMARQYVLIDYDLNIIEIGTGDKLVDAKIIVNGSDVTGNNHVKYNLGTRIAELPLLFIVEQAGGTYEWITENIVSIKCGDESIDFDLSDMTEKFVNRADDSSLYTIYKSGDEIIIDSILFNRFFVKYYNIFSYRLKFNCDYYDRSINLEISDESPRDENARLFIDGTEVSTERIKINRVREGVAFPLLLVIRELGGTVEWTNDDKVLVVLGDTSKTLDINELFFSMPLVGMGGYSVLEYTDGEILVDNTRMRIYWLEPNNIDIEIDYNNKIINIYTV